jgi:methylaspartate ammonia-lyase
MNKVVHSQLVGLVEIVDWLSANEQQQGHETDRPQVHLKAVGAIWGYLLSE